MTPWIFPRVSIAELVWLSKVVLQQQRKTLVNYNPTNDSTKIETEAPVIDLQNLASKMFNFGKFNTLKHLIT